MNASDVDLVSLPNDQDSSGRTLGAEEIALLEEVIRSGTLTSTKGSMVRRLEEGFAQMLGVKHVLACASGTAAVHCAVAALKLEPGDEIITTPITDMGAITPIIYESAIPVFADVDPVTMNVTAQTVAAATSPRTRAIIVTHLFGNPCEVSKIKAYAERRGIAVIEDCSQSFLAEEGNKRVGTVGEIGCFSLQQGKHITTGEGGLVVTNSDDLARQVRLYVNKAWGYGDPNPDHYFLALNYRMTELQGAVALAQLDKLEDNVRRRQQMAQRLDGLLAGLGAIRTPQVAPGNRHVYWRYPLMVDTDRIEGGPTRLAAAIKGYNIASAPRYIQKPAFQCQVIKEQKTFGQSRYPFTLARPEAIDYAPDRFPGTFKALSQVLVLPWNERYCEHHVDFIARAVKGRHDELVASPDDVRR